MCVLVKLYICNCNLKKKKKKKLYRFTIHNTYLQIKMLFLQFTIHTCRLKCYFYNSQYILAN